MKRPFGMAVAVAATVLLAACSGPGSTSSSSGGGGVAVGSQPAGAGNPGSTPAAVTARQVVTTATASLTVKDPADSAQRVSELVEGLGGRVDERTEQSAPDGNGHAGADLVVRVPAPKLTGLLADLKKLGEETDVSVSRSDVTGTAVDLDARISALRTSVVRLQGLMNNATTTDALLAAEKALSDRQANLESLQSQRTLLADQVTLSTLTVHLQSLSAAPARGPHGFLDGLGAGWRALVTTLGVAVVVLGVLLPWLVLAAVVAAVALVVVRRVRRQRRARPEAAVPPTPSTPPGPPQESEHAPV